MSSNSSANRHDAFSKIRAEGWLSVLVNIFLFAIKYWAGVVSGSLALIADAWHTLSDSLSSVIVIVGAKYSLRPADKKHPFGHGRTELIASLFIGFLLLVVAFYFAIEGIERLKNHQPAHYGTIAIAVTVFSILLKEGIAQYAFWVGRRTGSRSVIADGWHHRSDALSSVVVIVGILVGRYYWWIDGAMGILIALFIAYSSVKIIKESIDVLLGEETPRDLIDSVEKIIEGMGHSLTPHHFHIHNYITHRELTFHVRFPNPTRVDEAHRVVSAIEAAIREQLQIDATIHIEPEITSGGCKHID